MFSSTCLYESKYLLKPRFHEIDSYGIAHHTAYLCWFEEGRIRFLEDCDIEVDHLLRNQIAVVLTGIQIKFIKSVTNRSEIEICTEVRERPISKLKFIQKARCSVTKENFVTAEVDAAILQNGLLRYQVPFELKNPIERKAYVEC